MNSSDLESYLESVLCASTYAQKLGTQIQFLPWGQHGQRSDPDPLFGVSGITASAAPGGTTILSWTLRARDSPQGSSDQAAELRTALRLDSSLQPTEKSSTSVLVVGSTRATFPFAAISVGQTLSSAVNTSVAVGAFAWTILESAVGDLDQGLSFAAQMLPHFNSAVTDLVIDSLVPFAAGDTETFPTFVAEDTTFIQLVDDWHSFDKKHDQAWEKSGYRMWKPVLLTSRETWNLLLKYDVTKGGGKTDDHLAIYLNGDYQKFDLLSASAVLQSGQHLVASDPVTIPTDDDPDSDDTVLVDDFMTDLQAKATALDPDGLEPMVTGFVNANLPELLEVLGGGTKSWGNIPFDSLDAGFYSRGRIAYYFFSGSQYSKMFSSGETQFPWLRETSEGWEGIFDSIDAVVANPKETNWISYFFSGDQAQRYDDDGGGAGSVVKITDAFPGADFTQVDAAFYSGWNHRIYLFSFADGRYARLSVDDEGTPTMDPDYPKSIQGTDWDTGIPFDSFDAMTALADDDESVAIFSGDQFVLFNHKHSDLQGPFGIDSLKAKWSS